jgi:hypothetical protein
MDDANVETQIKQVIECWFGKNLWIYRPEYDYEESVAPFIKDLTVLTSVYSVTDEPDRQLQPR